VTATACAARILPPEFLRQAAQRRPDDDRVRAAGRVAERRRQVAVRVRRLRIRVLRTQPDEDHGQRRRRGGHLELRALVQRRGDSALELFLVERAGEGEHEPEPLRVLRPLELRDERRDRLQLVDLDAERRQPGFQLVERTRLRAAERLEQVAFPQGGDVGVDEHGRVVRDEREPGRQGRAGPRRLPPRLCRRGNARRERGREHAEQTVPHRPRQSDARGVPTEPGRTPHDRPPKRRVPGRLKKAAENARDRKPRAGFGV
jgi:hypothetical protein